MRANYQNSKRKRLSEWASKIRYCLSMFFANCEVWHIFQFWRVHKQPSLSKYTPFDSMREDRCSTSNFSRLIQRTVHFNVENGEKKTAKIKVSSSTSIVKSHTAVYLVSNDFYFIIVNALSLITTCCFHTLTLSFIVEIKMLYLSSCLMKKSCLFLWKIADVFCMSWLQLKVTVFNECATPDKCKSVRLMLFSLFQICLKMQRCV